MIDENQIKTQKKVLNINENRTYQNLQDKRKAILREKCMKTLKQRMILSNLLLYLKKLGKEQTKHKVIIRKKITKIRTE